MGSDIFAINWESLRVSVRPIATTRFPMIVVDDVYRDPHAVRALALSLPYVALGAGNPGGRAEVRGGHDLTGSSQLVQQLLGEAYGRVVPDVDADGNPATRFHRMRCEGADPDPDVHMPHVDQVMLAGVVYLNLPEHCRGGTAYFRHRETGIAEWRVRTERPVDPVAIRAALGLGFDEDFRRGVGDGRWRDYDELRPLIFEGPRGPRDFMSNGSSMWDRIDAVEMRWNRLVCFPGFVFHTSHYHPSWFGTTDEEERLTQNLLYHWPGLRDASPRPRDVEVTSESLR